MKHKTLLDSPRYRDFVTGRDQALEAILSKYLRACDVVVAKLMKNVSAVVSHTQVRLGGALPRNDARLEAQIGQIFQASAQELTHLFVRMRTSVYLLSHVGEGEAIARTYGKEMKVHAPGSKIQTVASLPTPSGGSISERVDLALYRLRAKVMAALKLAQMLGKSPAETLDAIERAFPKREKARGAARVLKRVNSLKEAQGPKNLTLVTGIIDQPTWEQAREDYLEDEIPGPRGPGDKMALWSVGQDGAVELQERYEWELEKEITQDFIEQVRAGQVDAANENGISDFQWVAVIDDHTDECCSKRDGLSSAEIERELSSGKLDEDECDATVPPGHFNCRCVPAPIADDMPEVPPPDFGSFDDWLESKKAA